MEKDKSVSRYHQMEMKYKLFEIGYDQNLPIWDLIRVDMYFNNICDFTYNANQSAYSNILYDNWVKTLYRWTKSLAFLFKRGKIVFVSRPRDVSSEGAATDKILKNIIDTCPPNKRLIIGGISHKENTSFNYYNTNLAVYFLRLFIKKTAISDSWLNKIIAAFRDTYGIDIAKKELAGMINYGILQYKAYVLLFKWLKPTKIFSSDPFKPIYAATRHLNIETFEFQHAGIFFDYLAYSYPTEITRTSNLAWADNYVTFGGKWGIDNHVPSKIINLGNNIFKPQNFKRHFSSEYFLIISDDEHNTILRPLAKDLSVLYENSKIIYKLHPSEFNNVKSYRDEFCDNPNVIVVSNEYFLFDLIKYMKMMILVYSSTFFEAMSLNKKVAVLKYDNSYLLNEFIQKEPNATIVENIDDIRKFDELPEVIGNSSYYDSFDLNTAKELLFS